MTHGPDYDALSARYLSDDPPLSAEETRELQHGLSSLNWFELVTKKEGRQRREFLKDKSPMDVLLWLMRAGDTDPNTRATAAIALLPYMHAKKDAIEPPDQT